MNIYPQTLAGIAALIGTMDGNSEALKKNDSGVVLGSMPLYSTDGHALGAVNWDEDQHPYFTPSDTMVDDITDEWTEIYRAMDAAPMARLAAVTPIDGEALTHPADGAAYKE